MRLISPVRLLTALVLCALPASAHAQFTVYADLASFLAATSNAGTDNFSNLSIGTTPSSPLARAAGSYAYTASVNTTSFFVTGTSAPWLSTNTSTDIITLSGFGSTVRGVGGFFFGTDDVGAFRTASLLIKATSAGGTSSQTLAATTVGAFLGFVSASPFVSLTIQVPDQSTFTWPTTSGVVIAQGRANVVPEPSTLLLVAAGTLLVVLLARARHAAA